MEATIDKLNLQKADPSYYKATKTPELRDLEPYYYLSVSGRGNPNAPEFLQAIEKMYAVAYAIKFTCKAEDMDFVVPKMEGFWWIDGGLEAQHKFTQTPPEEWNWKIVIRMPDFVEGDHFYRAVQKVKTKNPELLPEDEVKFELINEGLSVQILHIGSYHKEEPSIMKMLEFAKENGLVINGHHHEIYLSDPRKTLEEKLKTILRYSVKKI
ncbi:MAG: GyrI-like domain-containing protein [Ekhidna sp.]|uniref:GyrI-like domain-containing protein n=1 Tax=Ekhidna sp. TaxID=2608089 RepID=UPI0032EEA7FC